MCPPTYFDVRYAINPWMDPTDPPEPTAAQDQWHQLHELLLALGHRVDLVEPVPGLPDMVFAANAATVLDGRVLVANFRHAERGEEAGAYEAWFRAHGFTTVEQARQVNEGQGDHLVAAEVILAGHGFRTHPDSHAQTSAFLRRRLVPLTLVDPRFYHLDTALAAVSHDEIIYYPEAFSPPAQARLAAMFPDALRVDEATAATFALNAISDGHNVILPAAAASLAVPLKARGYQPHFVETGELMKAGGGPKCCVLDLHPEPVAEPAAASAA
ncbi:dimethylargininase [Streptacidiphilus neutrinimicus]|uniref:dimethylargininase n=1 Tax=Streptacidiphilus neutrinimicus TaxID=105420 RepID=UPI0005A8C337|nr:dimethylargininase [Streptacidiphilus neutrinimicus]